MKWLDWSECLLLYFNGSSHVPTRWLSSPKVLPVYTPLSCLGCPLPRWRASLLGSRPPSVCSFRSPLGPMPFSWPLPPNWDKGTILRMLRAVSKHKADKPGSDDSHFRMTFVPQKNLLQGLLQSMNQYWLSLQFIHSLIHSVSDLQCQALCLLFWSPHVQTKVILSLHRARRANSLLGKLVLIIGWLLKSFKC